MNAYSGKEHLTFAQPSLSRVAPRHNAADRAPGLLARLAGVARAVAELPRRYAALNELYSMTDRELADIGLTRGDVPQVFARSYARRGAI